MNTTPNENNINPPPAPPTFIPPQPISTPPSSPSQKPFLVIGIILLLLVATSGAYFLGKSQNSSKVTTTSPTPTSSPAISSSPSSIPPADPTADWKTYINTKYGYSFKYPSEFSIVKGPADNLPDDVFKNSDQISFESTNRGRFDIIVGLKDASGKPIQCSTDNECLEKEKEVLKIQLPDVINNNLNKIIFDKERKGFEHIVKNNLYTQGFEYFVFIEKGKVWQVGLPGSSEQNKSSSELIYDQILSTFKFTDSTNEINCKTDSDCGIESCGCTVKNKNFIDNSKGICTIMCGTPLCVNNICELQPYKAP